MLNNMLIDPFTKRGKKKKIAERSFQHSLLKLSLLSFCHFLMPKETGPCQPFWQERFYWNPFKAWDLGQSRPMEQVLLICSHE